MRESNVSALTAAGPNMNGICRLTSPMTTTDLPWRRCGANISSKSTVTSGFDPRLIFGAPLDAAFRHQLSNDIDAVGRDIAGNMRVVAADIVTLRMRNVEQRAGIEKEFDDLHIFRHIAAVQISDIVEGHAAAEQALDHGLQKQPLQLAVHCGARKLKAVNILSAMAGSRRARR